MMRRRFIVSLLATLIAGKVGAETPPKKSFPPVPTWRPSFTHPIDRIADRVSYYYNGKTDFVIFRNGTCVILDKGLSDSDASSFSLKVLADIFGYHPDMNLQRWTTATSWSDIIILA